MFHDPLPHEEVSPHFHLPVCCLQWRNYRCSTCSAEHGPAASRAPVRCEGLSLTGADARAPAPSVGTLAQGTEISNTSGLFGGGFSLDGADSVPGEAEKRETCNTRPVSGIAPAQRSQINPCPMLTDTLGELPIKTENAQKSPKAPRRLSCKICKEEFPNVLFLRRHKIDIHHLGKFACPVCKKHFKHRSTLKKHRDVQHGGGKLFYCDGCEKYLKTHDQLKQHQRDHANPEGITCPECGRKFLFRSSFRKHMSLHRNGPHKCELCSSSFRDRSKLKFHMKKHEDNYVAPTFACEFCEKVYLVEQNLQLHVKKVHKGETESHVCETCGKSMASKQSLIHHQYIHLGRKPFACHLCDKSFAKPGRLTDHIRTHNNETPFKCEFCEKSFSMKKTLKSHMMALHEGKKHLCAICGKALSSAESLKVHTRMHTGEKPFSWSIRRRNHTFVKSVGKATLKALLCRYT
ncbi:zinc finger protein OZF-like [Zophobas morio]|uniref:zinc finger protein OZF-like n=1 Tax=Zophobas morio TaxID=2755281 RepID=UPI0030837D66